MRKLKTKLSLGEYIPCLYLPHLNGSNKILIYFHGNAEDVGLATELLNFLKDMLKVSYWLSLWRTLKVNILAMEYPGYGVYIGDPSPWQIALDAQNVYDYLTLVQGIEESQIILFGRSIGSGPATLVSSLWNPCALLLMSPFTAIRDIVKEQAGSLTQYAICDHFRNIDLINKVHCPTFFVHGQKDRLIPFS